MELYVDAIVLGLWAALFVGKLTRPMEIFAFWPGLVRWLTTGRTEPKATARMRVHELWAVKVGFACASCHAGFVSLALYAAAYLGGVPVGFWEFFSFAVVAMFTAWIIETKLTYA